MYNSDPYSVIKDEQLQYYVQQLKDIDFQNRHTTIIDDG
jgi:hypothetical protein